jgi:hypothetical protein
MDMQLADNPNRGPNVYAVGEGNLTGPTESFVAYLKLELLATRYVMVVFGIKLPAMLIQTAAVVLLHSDPLSRSLPACTWDLFHLSEWHLICVQVADPFIYLLTFRDLRREFFRIFRLSRRPSIHVQMS